MRRNVRESAFLSQRHKKTSTAVLVEWVCDYFGAISASV